MYRISVFLPVKPQKLTEHMRAFRFVPTKEGLLWNVKESYVRIRAMTNQREGKKWFGYHFESDVPLDVMYYLLDMLFNSYPTKSFTGVEYHLNEKLKTSTIRQIADNAGVPGMYKHGNVQILTLPTHTIMHRRGHFNQQQLYDCLREIERVKETINPSQVDLFSYADNQLEGEDKSWPVSR
ncbi:hypothetical protein ACTWQB_16205 [Piscibacillus sp. B03]|uniref:hypothetical protein n=1 Tax=Piscibacillus sp. B03 TaxID=3457430 RepID=UPI003FCD61A4